MQMNLNEILESAEATLTDVAARVGPFAAPIPTAYAVARSCQTHLGYAPWVALAAGVAIETAGIAAVNTALTLREYNATKRKADPAAPVALAFGLSGVYLVSAVGLAVAMEVVPSLSVYAPVIFPALSLCGATILGLRSDHRQRLAGIAQGKAERSAKRVHNKLHKSDAQRAPKSNGQSAQGSAQGSAQNGTFSDINRTRRERKEALLGALLEAYKGNPNLGATEAARALGVHRNTVYSYTSELESAGKLSKNGGDGWVVQ